MTATLVPPAPRQAPAPPAPVPAAGWPAPAATAGLLLLFTVTALLYGRVFKGDGWQGAAIAPAVTAIAVTALTGRLLRSRPLAVAVDVVVVGLSVLWTVIPATTVAGLPLGRTWRAVGAAAAAFPHEFTTSSPPVEPTRAFLLLAGAGLGGAALASAWLRRRDGRPAWAAVPALLAFMASCLLAGPGGRVLAVIVETATLGVYLLLERAAADTQPARWVGGRRPEGWDRTRRVGGRVVLLGALSAAVVAAVPGPDGHGAFGWKDIGTGGTRIIISPMVSLSTRLAPHNAAADVFTVRSPVPSYWLLTTLDVYSGDTWQAGRASYSNFDVHLPRAQAGVPKGTRVVRERFHIEALDSPWLPVAFHPLAVSGVSGVQYNAPTGSLLTKRRTADGLSYTVTSAETLAAIHGAGLRRAPALDPKAEPAGSSALPPSVPADVVALAHRIVKGARTEYAEALALQDFFYGPEFAYSLHPPVDGSGEDAIESFLFQTRVGYCQQFAGAYAVMARSVGLPTRLAVGFTTGQPLGGGRYRVTDADVHTWPEVWFPRYGWVPFEPTKGPPHANFAIPGTAGYAATGATAGQAAGHLPHPPGSSQGPAPGTSATTVPARGGSAPAHRPGNRVGPEGILPHGAGGAPTPAVPTARARNAAFASSSLTWALVLLAAAAGGLVALALANTLARSARRLRRRRRIAAAGRSTAGMPLRWEEMTEALAVVGMRRRAWETTPMFAARVAAELDGPGRLTGPFLDAARMVEAASWRADGAAALPVDPAAVAAVAEVTRRAHLRLRRRDRLRLLLDARLAWRPEVVDPDGTRVVLVRAS